LGRDASESKLQATFGEDYKRMQKEKIYTGAIPIKTMIALTIPFFLVTIMFTIFIKIFT